MRILGLLGILVTWLYHIMLQAWYGVAAAVIGFALLRGTYLALGEGDYDAVWFLGALAVALLTISVVAVRRSIRDLAQINAAREGRF